MRCSSSAAAIIAAMAITTAVAGPTHRHAHAHTKRGWVDVDYTNKDLYKNVDWSKMDWASILGGKPSAGAAAPAPSAAANTENTTSDNNDNDGGDAISNTISSVTSGLSDAIDGLFASVSGVADDITHFGGQSKSSGAMGDFYLGNVGIPWGTNMMKVGSTDGYDRTIDFKNTQDHPIKIFLWNKAGKDGQVLSGGATASKTPALTLTLGAGDNQIVAFDKDSQIGFAEGCDTLTQSGHFQTSFGECNFPAGGGPTCNLSAILNKIFQDTGKPYEMNITNEENSCKSNPQENSWIAEAKYQGDLSAIKVGLDGVDRNGSCYVAGDQGHFTAEMGGQQ